VVQNGTKFMAPYTVILQPYVTDSFFATPLRTYHCIECCR